MAFKILYVEDQKADSRELDLKNLGFEVVTYDPSSNISEFLQVVTDDVDAIVMDYRLTRGDNHSSFDAPTIAATLRSKHGENFRERPIILMSNEDEIVFYYKDFTNQDLFDFAISKKDFLNDKESFKNYCEAFIMSYKKIKKDNFSLPTILGISAADQDLIHSQILIRLGNKAGYIYEHSRFINATLLHSVGILIGEDVLASRLGVSKASADWPALKQSIENAKYEGILSEIHSRWWMQKINRWWIESIGCSVPLRRLEAVERVQILKEKLQLQNLETLEKTSNSHSTNFWTICKFSLAPIDPFDGIEILKKDILPWQEKEYISVDTALTKMDLFKNYVSEVDKKSVRELAQKLNKNE